MNSPNKVKNKLYEQPSVAALLAWLTASLEVILTVVPTPCPPARAGGDACVACCPTFIRRPLQRSSV